MVNVDVVAALRAKQSELASERAGLLQRAEKLAADTAVLERAVTVLVPEEASKSQPRGKPNGDGSLVVRRDVLACIRVSPRPITVSVVAASVAAEKGLDLGDDRRSFERRVSTVLRGLKRAGILVSDGTDAEGRSAYAPAA